MVTKLPEHSGLALTQRCSRRLWKGRKSNSGQPKRWGSLVLLGWNSFPISLCTQALSCSSKDGLEEKPQSSKSMQGPFLS